MHVWTFDYRALTLMKVRERLFQKKFIRIFEHVILLQKYYLIENFHKKVYLRYLGLYENVNVQFFSIDTIVFLNYFLIQFLVFLKEYYLTLLQL